MFRGMSIGGAANQLDAEQSGLGEPDPQTSRQRSSPHGQRGSAQRQPILYRDRSF